MRDFSQLLSLVALVAMFFSSIAGASFLVGDLTGDNEVNIQDILVMADQWLSDEDSCLEQGLVAHWKLDESIEAVATDSSQYNRDGIVYGDSLWLASNGKVGGAIELDGFEDYIDIPGYAGITGSNPRTCSAWIKTAEVDGDIITWGEMGTHGYRWIIRVNESGFLRAEVGGGYAVGTGFIADNSWHHIAVASDGTSTDKIKFYVDGELNATGDVQSKEINTSGANDVKIGVYSDSQQYFMGRIDDVRIYDRVVNAQEIWSLATLNTTASNCADIDYNEGVNVSDFARLAGNWNEKTPPIFISEIMADNDLSLTTRVEGVEESPDWIEIFNSTSENIDLTDWSLTDKADNLSKWQFPAGTIIGSGEYMVVFASEKREVDYPDNFPYVDDDNNIHTNFKLTSDGEFLALVRPDDIIAHAYDAFRFNDDEFGYPPQEEDISYGIQYNEFRYFGIPTPGTANAGGFLGFLGKPKLDHEAGFYDTPFNLVISCDTPDTIIRYTSNGREPLEDNGVKYTGPIVVSDTVCLRARAFKSGYQPSRVRTASFLFNVSDTVKSLPVISIVGDNKTSLFEPDGIMAIIGGYYSNGWKPSAAGDYNNPMQRGIEYERPVSVEILNADGKNDTQIDCGIRVAGSDWHRPRYTRGDNWTYNYNKFSLKFFFRGSYGDSTFDYRMFPQFPAESFKSVIIRGGHNDVQNPFIKDEFLRRVHLDMDRVAAAGTLMNLFLNGEHKAYYNPTERLDHDFFRKYYNSDNDWDVITQRDVRNGDSIAWNDLLNFFNTYDLSIATNYQEAVRRFDVADFIDYLIVQLYCVNWDWPQNNWTSARERVAGAKFRFYLWDVEGSFRSQDLYNHRIGELNSQSSSAARIYRSLKANPDFRQLFADLLQKHFYNDGAMSELNLTMRFQHLRDELAMELPGMDLNILNSWIPNRGEYLVGQFKNEGFFPIEGPKLNINGDFQHGGYVENGASLTIDNPSGQGVIWYTTDGVDPRQPVTPEEDSHVLVSTDAEKSVLVPDSDIGTSWRGGNEPFNDSQWQDGTPANGGIGAIGYERNSGYQDRITYDVENELFGNNYRSALVRISFDVDAGDLAGYNLLTLNMRYDDGFVAYINGSEVERKNITGTPGTNATVQSHEDEGPVKHDISDHIDKLKAGKNILAIHAMNATATSSDFIILPELIAGHSTPGGGGIAPGAVRYSQAATLDKSVHVKARALDGNTWSALSEAVFVVGALHKNLRISEIMYHPKDPNNGSPDAEFIELRNSGNDEINLNLAKFTNGIDFEFGDLSLAPSENILVVNNQAVFMAKYPDFDGTIAGEFAGSLDNAGEKIKIEDGLGRTVINVKYDDDWFDITDGEDFSLTLKDAPQTLTTGLVGSWKMDEPIGSLVGDCSGNGLTAKITELPYWQRHNGKSGGALLFNGNEGYVKVKGYKGILGSAPRSCSAWVKTTSPKGEIISWGLGGSSGSRWILNISSGGRLTAGIGGAGITGSKWICDGKWHHVAVTSDGSNIANAMLYVDGEIEELSSVSNVPINTVTGYNVCIGVFLHSLNYFDGLIDNVSIYDRVLSADEVAALADSDDYWDSKQYWRPSAGMGGSPGTDDTGIVPELGDIVINEVLSHSHSFDPDWIELFNTTDFPINIGGWFLSDSDADYMKYQIPAGTIIPEGGYKVFYETTHFGSAFALSENGDEVYLRSGLDAQGNITGYYAEEIFGASVTNIAFGRYQKSTGAYNFVAMSQNSPNNANAYPLVDSIVISEIMYNPAPGGTFDKDEYEYVELFNAGGSTVTLQEYDDIRGTTLPWQFDDGIDYVFPLGTTIVPGERVLIVRNTDAFAERYSSVTGVQIFGPYDGNLNNGGEKLDLSRPGDVDLEGVRHYIRVDRVNYNDSSEWPQGPDGGGNSLTRMNNTEYGNDVINWKGATPSPGQ